MALITAPTTLQIGQQRIELVTYDLSETSDASGFMAVRSGGPPRWRMSLGSPRIINPVAASAWKSLILRLRGRVNHLAIWDAARPAPMGTLRGTLTLAAGVGAGAASLSITGGAGQAGRTLLAGDWLQLSTGVGSSQLVCVTADAIANGSGVIAASIEPPLRIGFGGGAAVTWDRPVGYYRQRVGAAGWDNQPNAVGQGGFALDLVEQWS
jgi:hypothetical protein